MLQREYCPGLKDIVLRTMDILRTDSECLEALSLTLPSEVAAFHGLPPEIQRAFARQVRRKELRESGRSASFREITLGEAVGTNEQAATDAKGTPVPARTLQFRRGKWSGEIHGPQGEIALKTGAVVWELLSRPLSFRRSLQGIEQLDADRIGSRVTIRHWRPGDRFQPLGMTVLAKLQDLFVNRKVPAAVRRERHLATTEAGDIFWVEGFPPGELFKLTAGTKRILKWQLVSGKTA
jgi:tRNA(Ile)-lysidine synthetase-like protein